MEERREEAGNELTAAVADRARKVGLDARGEVLHGEPADQITEYARVHGIDPIVLGARTERGRQVPARERSKIVRDLRANQNATRSDDVAGKVARHAPTPVMLVRTDG